MMKTSTLHCCTIGVIPWNWLSTRHHHILYCQYVSTSNHRMGLASPLDRTTNALEVDTVEDKGYQVYTYKIECPTRTKIKIWVPWFSCWLEASYIASIDSDQCSSLLKHPHSRFRMLQSMHYLVSALHFFCPDDVMARVITLWPFEVYAEEIKISLLCLQSLYFCLWSN